LSGAGSDGSSIARPTQADVIVVAAGRSSRMGGTDKLMAPIAGRPLLAWTLSAVAATPAVERIVVVTSPDRVEALRAASWLPGTVSDVVAGGDRRQESVAAGFAALAPDASDDDRIVLVHDGARPLVTPGLVASVIESATAHGAAIPVLPVAETLKRVDGDLVAETVDRSLLGAAQTPQGVRRGLLREAYRQYPPDGPQDFTDEAALLEACRIAVHVVPGDPSNLKVTQPADLRRAASGLADRRTIRTGIGVDAHPFGPGEPLALGGLLIDGAPRLAGHSDGDVAMHAICDALLGAAGLGDLGRVFPAGPATPKGIASREMVAEVVRQVAAAGWHIEHVDLTITAARPKLAPHLDGMREAIAAALGAPASAVNVKASSGNLLGDEGAGRAISAIAIATLDDGA
jgi:2-C-methyl-D-erythritol 4-phosphate cytidylyltransferase / 2-C-methyl-D-erythritol 2,4-cyclodiphosphate synthase